MPSHKPDHPGGGEVFPNLFTSNTQINNAAFGALNNADDPFAIQAVIKFTF